MLRGNEGAAIGFEALTRPHRQVRHERQVVRGGGNGDMAHVEGQERQFRLNIGAGLIPAPQHLDGEMVSEIMHARQTPVRRAQAGILKQGAESLV